MFNPLIRNRKYLYIYLSVWGMLTLMQVFIVFIVYDFSLGEALADGLIYNGLYAVIALIIWYVVRYSDLENQGWFMILLNHLGTVAIVTFLWILTSNFLLKNTFEFSAQYKNFVDNAFVWRFISGVFLYMVVILIYYLIIYYANLQEKIKQEAELNFTLKETELNALKSQINPHFLFNSLNSISSLTVSKPSKAQEMIIKLGEYLRYSLAHDETNLTTFSTEYDNAMTYLEIEKIRFGDKLTIENNIDVNCMEKTIPAMILQPIYENAIKHGVYESTGIVMIHTKCLCINDLIKVSIKNNFDPEAVHRKGAGIGLKNVKNRMKLIYERTDLVRIFKEKDSFEVELIFPGEKV